MNFKPTTLFITIILLAIIQSCTVPNPYQPVDNTSNTNSTNENNGGGTTTTGGITLSGSSAGDNESHNMGQNCMNCHYPGGSGSKEGVWQIGGTVYNQAGTVTKPNAVIKFFTGPNGTGTLKYTLNADAFGNLYSKGPVDFTGGLFPAVVGSTRTNYMSSSITSGACNSCHTGGTGTARVWTN
jgi:hypothetical protein